MTKATFRDGQKMLTEIKEIVKDKYGQAALRVTSGGSLCCGTSAALDGCCDPITSNLYGAIQMGELPETAVLASLGCGNPTALAGLRPGRNSSGSGIRRRNRGVYRLEDARAFLSGQGMDVDTIAPQTLVQCLTR